MTNEMQAAFYIIAAGCWVYLGGKPAAVGTLAGLALISAVELFK